MNVSLNTNSSFPQPISSEANLGGLIRMLVPVIIVVPLAGFAIKKIISHYKSKNLAVSRKESEKIDVPENTRKYSVQKKSFEALSDDVITKICIFLGPDIRLLYPTSTTFFCQVSSNFHLPIQRTQILEEKSLDIYFRITKMVRKNLEKIKKPVSSHFFTQYWNSFNQSDVLTYAEFFKILNSELVALSLAKLPVTDSDMEALAEQCRNLKTLNISRCTHITDLTLEKITKMFPKLLEISFQGCTGLTPVCVALFKRSFPEIKHHLSSVNQEMVETNFQVELDAFRILDNPDQSDPGSLEVMKQVHARALKSTATDLNLSTTISIDL